MNDLLSFKDKKDRNDFLIALVVLSLFGWFFYHTLFCNEPLDLNQMVEKPQAVLASLADKDNDGISDDKDACPLIAGIKKNNGCPADADGDGVYDADDKCPYTRGTIATNGCPESEEDLAEDVDTDGDGIINKKDKCPRKKGTLENNGCPLDADNDGIYDEDDKCPALAGIPENNGCPADSDKDGIYDNKDRCPQLAGVPSNNGCPADADNDGVYDEDDKCPNLKGVAANNGCPADSDGDGVYDSKDKCPNKAGTVENNGCPKVTIEAEDKAILDDALQAVQFAPNRAVLLNSSKSVLDQIVTVLKKYPDYKVAIHGHTDAIGGDKDNLILSKERAKACLDFLASKGINKNRMTSDGFGETKPKADNNTKTGRRINRRVEFNLSY